MSVFIIFEKSLSCEISHFIRASLGISTKSLSTLTLNSTVGLESLILGKKLILLGESCFKIDGITKFPESRDQLVDCINSLDSWELDLGQVEKYLDYLNEIYCVQQSWRNPSEQHFESLEKRFKKIIYS